MNRYLEIAKKNIPSILCGIFALVGIIAIYYPISGYFDGLHKKAEERKSSFSAMEALLKKERHLPVVSLEGPAQGESLKVFPTEAVSAKAKTVTDNVHTQAAEMLAAAVKISQRGQLIPNALPNGSPEPAANFRREYGRQFDFISEETRANSFPVRIMKAGFPPTEQQIVLAKQKAADEINAKKAYAGNQVLNQAQIDAELLASLPQVADTLKTQAAEGCKVYVEPNAFHQYQGFSQLKPGDFATPGMLFNAQAGMWVQQDIAQAIAVANSKSPNVTKSPVKHVLKIDMADELFRQTAAVASADPAAAAPAAASADPSQAITPNFALSLSGRASNGLYDVVPFALKIDVDATQLPLVLRCLSQNRFMNVLNCNVTAVDLALMKANGFFYGDNPVVTLDLQCEELLLREWTAPLMPLNIKQANGVAMPAPAAAPAG